MKRVTIKDLAKALNLNVSTISRALSDHPNVAAATKQRVKALAKELKYKPNMLAKNFRNSETKLIALIVPEMNMFFVPSLIKAVSTALEEHGYNLLLMNSQESLDKEIANIQQCEAYSVDGIMISVSFNTSDLNHLVDMMDTDLPIVQFDRVIKEAKIPSVTINDQEAASMGTQILIDQGASNVYGIFGNRSLRFSQDRSQGFRSALIQAGLPIEDKTKFAKTKEDITDILTNDILKRPDYPLAIFCNSDETLVETYKTLTDLDIKIPEQVNLSCISDGITPKMLKIDIPYIEHSGYNVGWEAAQLLLKMIKQPNLTHQNSEVSTRLVANS